MHLGVGVNRGISGGGGRHARRCGEGVLIVGVVIEGMIPLLISLSKALIAGCGRTMFLGRHGGGRKRGCLLGVREGQINTWHNST